MASSARSLSACAASLPRRRTCGAPSWNPASVYSATRATGSGASSATASSFSATFFSAAPPAPLSRSAGRAANRSAISASWRTASGCLAEAAKPSSTGIDAASSRKPRILIAAAVAAGEACVFFCPRNCFASAR